MIPDIIKYLSLGETFSHPIIRLPKNIESITLSSQYKYLEEFKIVHMNILQVEEKKYSMIKFVKKKNNENITNLYNIIIENFNNLIEYLEFDIFV